MQLQTKKIDNLTECLVFRPSTAAIHSLFLFYSLTIHNMHKNMSAQCLPKINNLIKYLNL